MIGYFPIVWSREAEVCRSLETLTKGSGTLHSYRGSSATYNDGSTSFGPESLKWLARLAFMAYNVPPPVRCGA